MPMITPVEISIMIRLVTIDLLILDMAVIYVPPFLFALGFIPVPPDVRRKAPLPLSHGAFALLCVGNPRICPGQEASIRIESNQSCR
jgi:hypothetical protein